MTSLSVNVNKIATLRNSRGKNTPDVVKTALDIVSYGAQGITVHPRPDGRHIRRDDVYALADAVNVEFNIEGYPSADFLEMVRDVRPAQCTLVPDPPDVLTSNAGWQVAPHQALLKQVIRELHESGIRVSLFVDPFRLRDSDLAILKDIEADRIELYTEAYADAFETPKRDEVTAVYRIVAEKAQRLGIGLNAGHDLNLRNLRHLVTEVPGIEEVSIGHALIADALYLGLKETVRAYLDCLRL